MIRAYNSVSKHSVLMIKIIKNRFAEPFTPFDLLLVGLLFSGLLTLPYYTSFFWKVTFSMGGWRVPLIKFSWFYTFFIVSNGLWLVLSLFVTSSKDRLSKKLIAVFIISNLFGAVLILTNLLHFSLFRENWNYSTLTAAYLGVKGGQAPLNLNLVHAIIALVCTLAFITLLLWVSKLVPRPQQCAKLSSRVVAFLSFSLLFMLISIQRVIPPNWHSLELQTFIPWITFVKPTNDLIIEDPKLQSLKSLEKTKAKALLALANKVKRLESISAEVKPNILIVHVEGLRDDMLQQSYMPNLTQFAKNHGEILLHHYASGNNTGQSLFSLLSGLHGTFYQNFRAKPGKLAPLEILRHLGYAFFVHNSMEDDFDGHGHLFYNRNGFTKHMVTEGALEENDQKLFSETIDQLTQKAVKANPRFDYLYLNSSHFPFDYPKAFEKHKPVLRGMDYDTSLRHDMELQKDALKNTYYNAVLYADHLLSQLLISLQKSSYWQNSIVMIVGDHGEEFWEHNRFGHVYGLVKEQVKVAAYVHFPSGLNTQYRYTAHHDFFPTIFSYMGVSLEAEDYMSGKNLFDFKPDRDYAISRMSVVASQQRYEETAISKDVKVIYELKRKLTIKSITDEDDEILLPLQDSQQAANDLLKRVYKHREESLEALSCP